MITAHEVRKYIGLSPDQKANEWVIDEKRIEHLKANVALPDNWLERVLTEIEKDIVSTARSFKNPPSCGVNFYPWICYDTLYGHKSLYLTKNELDIVAKRLEEAGYTFILGELCSYSNRYSNCTILWKEKQ